MTTPNDLSDKGLSIFVFAIYHQLTSGDAVTGVVANDGAGHKADPQGIAELEKLELAKLDGELITFTEAGQVMLSQLVDRLRGSW
jgi:hypothetical protein